MSDDKLKKIKILPHKKIQKFKTNFKLDKNINIKLNKIEKDIIYIIINYIPKNIYGVSFDDIFIEIKTYEPNATIPLIKNICDYLVDMKLIEKKTFLDEYNEKLNLYSISKSIILINPKEAKQNQPIFQKHHNEKKESEVTHDELKKTIALVRRREEKEQEDMSNLRNILKLILQNQKFYEKEHNYLKYKIQAKKKPASKIISEFEGRLSELNRQLNNILEYETDRTNPNSMKSLGLSIDQTYERNPLDFRLIKMQRKLIKDCYEPKMVFLTQMIKVLDEFKIYLLQERADPEYIEKIKKENMDNLADATHLI